MTPAIRFGLDGFDVIARRDVQRMPLTIFLTAHSQFAVQAFEAEVVDYLLKPVSEERFGATMRRLERFLRQGPGPRSVFRVTTGRGVVFLDAGDVEWIEAAGNYARLWLRDRSYLVRESLTELEPRLRAHGFLRVHRSAVVRLHCVTALTRDRHGALWALLESGARVPIARRRQGVINAAVRDGALK